MYLVMTVILACLIIQNYIRLKYKNNNNNIDFIYKAKLFNNLWPEIFNPLHFNKKHNKNQESYIATLVHDLKTPTSAQIRTLNLLLQGYFGNINTQQKEILKEVLYSEKYMSEIIANILTAYKFDCGELKLKKQNFDIADTLNTIYKSLNLLAEEKNQKIDINYHCTNLTFYGDKLQLTRVITNLISNAIKYGFPNSTININLSLDSKTLHLAVENQTNPIPKEKLLHIFDKFTGGMTHYNSASTGLGLYLSKKLVEIHNGKIFANCTSNGICTFGFNIPVTNDILDVKTIIRQ